MKGVIPHALSKLVIKKYGITTWLKCLNVAEINNRKVYLPIENVPDEEIYILVDAVSKVLNLSREELIKLFGKFWIKEYAYKMYKPFYNVQTAREFIENIPHIHKQVVTNIKEASPPEFELEWISEYTLLLHYKSKRDLLDLGIGLLQGVADFFQETISIEKLNNNLLKITFSR